ncbi:MAG TPA: hypothetical protein VFC02_14700 [Anaerolineales bacterium]|nr:hypothetical protein [Anaerolineales bacterium]
MSVNILVDGKAIGQKRPLFTDWHVELPPVDERNGGRLKLRDLIRYIVDKEVDAFKNRQEERKLARIMSRQDIAQGVERGKVDPGERDLEQSVDNEEAVAIALKAFEDGLYFVFVDEVQQTNLDSEVFLKTNSKVVFLRLTALVGG